MAITKEQTKAAMQTVMAVAEAIKTAESIPSGHLYALLMSKGISLSDYQAILGILTRGNLVEDNGHLLTWIGGR